MIANYHCWLEDRLHWRGGMTLVVEALNAGDAASMFIRSIASLGASWAAWSDSAGTVKVLVSYGDPTDDDLPTPEDSTDAEWEEGVRNICTIWEVDPTTHSSTQRL